MPVSVTLGNRFKGAPQEAMYQDAEIPLGDIVWSFLCTMFPHILSVCIGVFLIYLNKMVNDRHDKPSEPKSRSVVVREAPAPVVQAPQSMAEAPKPVAAQVPQQPMYQAPPPQPVYQQAPPQQPVYQAPQQPVYQAPKPAPKPVMEVRKPAPQPVAQAPAPAKKQAEPDLKEEEKDEVLPMLGLAKKAPPPVDMVSLTSTQSSEAPNTLCLKKIKGAFPNALTNAELVDKVASSLEEFGYGGTTLLATSLCCDEVNRVLDEQFHKVYEHHFSMGGLAGFPFGGVTSFGAMAHHIPDGGSCLVVYGPHVGIDSNGVVGMIDRRGRKNNGACCGSAADAANHVSEVRGGGKKAAGQVRPLDAQQAFVRSMLMPYGKRLENAKESTVELPYALYDAMDDMMRQIVTFGAGEVAGEGKIALLGGIQINTPEEHSDYFLPLTFEIRDNNNLLIENLTWW